MIVASRITKSLRGKTQNRMMMINKPIYMGLAKGLYEQERFDQFMEELRVGKSNGHQRPPIEINKESTGMLTTMYHLPMLGVGVQHKLFRFFQGFDTEVRLSGSESKRDNLESIEK